MKKKQKKEMTTKHIEKINSTKKELRKIISNYKKRKFKA
jgi:hypothetical protein